MIQRKAGSGVTEIILQILQNSGYWVNQVTTRIMKTVPNYFQKTNNGIIMIAQNYFPRFAKGRKVIVKQDNEILKICNFKNRLAKARMYPLRLRLIKYRRACSLYPASN